MDEKIFDLIVIGAGPGGYVAAIKAAKAGLKTAIVENRRVGGTCLNRGCIPAKAMIHASSLYREALEGARFGLYAPEAAYDYEEILAYKQESIDGLVGGVQQLFKGNGVTLLEGTGTLLAPAADGSNRVRVTSSAKGSRTPIDKESPEAGDERGMMVGGDVGGDANGDTAGHKDSSAGLEKTVVSAKNVILATGSKPARIPVPGLDLPHVLDSDGLFALEDAPRSLLIIGGGVIGVEFATVFSNLGSEVTIIEALPKLLDNFDKEISQNLKMILKKRGVESHLSAMVKECRPAAGEASSADAPGGTDAPGGVDASGGTDAPDAHSPSECKAATSGDICVVFEEKGKTQELSAEYVLVAAGRVPVMEGLLEEGVQLQMNGRFVAVDEHFQTSMPGVYAIGDLTGGIQLAHAASAHGVRVIEEILHTSQPASTDAGATFAQTIDVVPAGVYTDPEIAQVGLTEAQAKEEGIETRTGKFIMTANGKSLITKEERGFIKVVADAKSGRILGAQMMCARATDMIAEFTTAIVNQLTVSDMLRGIRPHPTYNEGIGEALEDVFGESLHTVPRRRR